MKKINLLVVLLVISSYSVFAWNPNPVYNPFEIIWNALYEVESIAKNDTLKNLECDKGQIAKWDSLTWICTDDDTSRTAFLTQPGVNFGNLVVEKIYRPDETEFEDFVKDYLDGKTPRKDAQLVYVDLAGTAARSVTFLDLKPVYYNAMRMDTITLPPLTEYIEFSVEGVVIQDESGGGLMHADRFWFEFGGTSVGHILSVKPPEIYFDHGIINQTFGNMHISSLGGNIAGMGVEIDSHSTGNWYQVDKGGINIKYSELGPIGASGEDVVISGYMTGKTERNYLLDWINNWIATFSPEASISIVYSDTQGAEVFRDDFLNARPTSYILPSTDSTAQNTLSESFSFTYEHVDRG